MGMPAKPGGGLREGWASWTPWRKRGVAGPGHACQTSKAHGSRILNALRCCGRVCLVRPGESIP
jgi:hypothetical protein